MAPLRLFTLLLAASLAILAARADAFETRARTAWV